MKFSKRHAGTLKHRFCEALCKDKDRERCNKLRESHVDKGNNMNNETMSKHIFFLLSAALT